MQTSARTIIFCLVALLLAALVQAQQLDVKRVELKGDEVIVHYALADSVAGRSYSVNLYSSLDTYVNPLARVTGDFGIEVKPGVQRTITWNAKQELGEAFNDKVSIELRARVFIPFIRFDSFEKIKRGKPTEVTWRGGTAQNILNFELWRAGKRVEVIPNIPNAHHAKIEIPSHVKAGKNYTFKIIDSKNKDLVIQTAPFTIKPKVPLLFKVLPLVIVGGVVGVLAGGKSVSTEQGVVDPPTLPTRN
jgi:Ser-Thr-rich glycosyl-phosphatidyl-inositol-anchored membrane family